MKKWNNPQLLNLMLQETKAVEDKGAWTHNCLAKNGDVPLSFGGKCYNENSDDPDTCGQGHENLIYVDHGFLVGKELISCCVSTETTMS